MSNNNFGIQGWEPRWYNSLPDLKNQLLNFSFVGKKIDACWTLWDKQNQFFEDAPIILIIEGQQYHFCALKFDEFSVTQGTINTNQKVAWCGGAPDPFGYLTWHKNKNLDFESIIGEKILKVEIVEYENEPGNPLPVVSQIFITGISFSTDKSYLEIFNAGDCNALTNKRNQFENLKYHGVEI